eukprot:1150646-Pelagomonas_calceolata.AAC.3
MVGNRVEGEKAGLLLLLALPLEVLPPLLFAVRSAAAWATRARVDGDDQAGWADGDEQAGRVDGDVQIGRASHIGDPSCKNTRPGTHYSASLWTKPGQAKQVLTHTHRWPRPLSTEHGAVHPGDPDPVVNATLQPNRGRQKLAQAWAVRDAWHPNGLASSGCGGRGDDCLQPRHLAARLSKLTQQAAQHARREVGYVQAWEGLVEGGWGGRGGVSGARGLGMSGGRRRGPAALKAGGGVVEQEVQDLQQRRGRGVRGEGDSKDGGVRMHSTSSIGAA